MFFFVIYVTPNMNSEDIGLTDLFMYRVHDIFGLYKMHIQINRILGDSEPPESAKDY